MGTFVGVMDSPSRGRSRASILSAVDANDLITSVKCLPGPCLAGRRLSDLPSFASKPLQECLWIRRQRAASGYEIVGPFNMLFLLAIVKTNRPTNGRRCGLWRRRVGRAFRRAGASPGDTGARGPAVGEHLPQDRAAGSAQRRSGTSCDTGGPNPDSSLNRVYRPNRITGRIRRPQTLLDRSHRRRITSATLRVGDEASPPVRSDGLHCVSDAAGCSRELGWTLG